MREQTPTKPHPPLVPTTTAHIAPSPPARPLNSRREGEESDSPTVPREPIFLCPAPPRRPRPHQAPRRPWTSSSAGMPRPSGPAASRPILYRPSEPCPHRPTSSARTLCSQIFEPLPHPDNGPDPAQPAASHRRDAPTDTPWTPHHPRPTPCLRCPSPLPNSAADSPRVPVVCPHQYPPPNSNPRATLHQDSRPRAPPCADTPLPLAKDAPSPLAQSHPPALAASPLASSRRTQPPPAHTPTHEPLPAQPTSRRCPETAHKPR